MARLVTPSRSALATELEVQRAVWKDTATAPLSPGHSEEEQDVLCAILNAVSDAVEQLLSGVIEREYSEYADGGSQWLLLRHRPIVAVLEVREGTRTLVEGVEYAVYHHLNRLRRLPGGTGRTETVLVVRHGDCLGSLPRWLGDTSARRQLTSSLPCSIGRVGKRSARRCCSGARRSGRLDRQRIPSRSARQVSS
jgi:hypothetical protein